MPGSRYQIAESKQQHGRNFIGSELTAAVDRIGGIAQVVRIAKIEGLAAWDERCGFNGVPVVDQDAGTDVKASAGREKINQRFRRA